MNNKLLKLKNFLIKKNLKEEAEIISRAFDFSANLDAAKNSLSYFTNLYNSIIGVEKSVESADTPYETNLSYLRKDLAEIAFTIADYDYDEIRGSLKTSNAHQQGELSGEDIKKFVESKRGTVKAGSFSLDDDYTVYFANDSFSLPDNSEYQSDFGIYKVVVDEGTFYNEVYFILTGKDIREDATYQKQKEEREAERDKLEKRIKELQAEVERLEKAKQKEAYEVTFEKTKPEEKKDGVFYYTEIDSDTNGTYYIGKDGSKLYLSEKQRKNIKVEEVK